MNGTYYISAEQMTVGYDGKPLIENIDIGVRRGEILTLIGPQMQTMMNELGYKNVFIGTVEGEPESTSCENVINAVHEAGYTKVVLQPLMVVAGDHANNDMADMEDPESWFSQFDASGYFDAITACISGLGRIEAIQEIYVEHANEVLQMFDPDHAAAAEVAALIDAIYVQERTDETDAQCAAAKAAWDALTDAQKELG